jgi:nitrate reductase (cytochrome), electron transfer subunit
MSPRTYRRAASVAGLILVTAAVSGYFMGLRQTGSQLNAVQTISLVPEALAHSAWNTETAAQMAKGYAEQRRLQDGPNAGWQSDLSKLVQPAADYHALTNVTDAERSVALQERAARRAYDGAPPVVPHPIEQHSAASCLSCHGPGLVIKDKVASKMSHAEYASCTQCHVPSVGSRIPLTEPALLEPLAENRFVGMNAPLKGDRAWAQAPPTIPHPTQMRADCLSCHGPQGLYGLRTPHPERHSCQQCHVPSAEMEQRHFFPAIAGEPPTWTELMNMARQ